jgi:hypothetical protein
MTVLSSISISTRTFSQLQRAMPSSRQRRRVCINQPRFSSSTGSSP